MHVPLSFEESAPYAMLRQFLLDSLFYIQLFSTRRIIDHGNWFIKKMCFFDFYRPCCTVHEIPNLLFYLIYFASILGTIIVGSWDPTLSIRARMIRKSLSWSVAGQISRLVWHKRRTIIELMQLLARSIHVAWYIDELLVKGKIASLECLDMSKLVNVDILVACARVGRVRRVQCCRLVAKSFNHFDILLIL